MLSFLPSRILRCVEHLNLGLLYELRLRADMPLRVNYGGRFSFLGEDGICGRAAALIPTAAEVASSLFAASEGSLYAVENQMRQGFVTAKGGVRIGIAGTFVYENGQVLAVRDVTSLCIRIPHAVEGCAREIYRRCLGEGLCSLLVLSPPGEGKTTILRDLARTLSEKTFCNLLICDERGELSASAVGITADVVRFADKKTAFTAGIRAMRPDVIVTDELLPEDYPAVKRARDGGISVIASAHLTGYAEVTEKIFDRYVLLSGLGKIEKILDSGGNDVD